MTILHKDKPFVRLGTIPKQRYRPVAPPKTCDQCGCTPCQTWTLCKRFRIIEQQIRDQRWREWRSMSFRPSEESKSKPAESTLAAYQYLRRLGDQELLQRFLDAHSS
jgi:hypothetical protein